MRYCSCCDEISTSVHGPTRVIELWKTYALLDAITDNRMNLCMINDIPHVDKYT